MTPLEAFDEYHQAVYSFIYRLTGRPDVSEDVTQDCFLAVVRHPGRFDEARGTLKQYLFSVARNLAIKRYRDEREGEQLPEEEPAAPGPGVDWDISSAVAAAVAALPAAQREALVLFEYEGLTLEEIAEAVGVDPGAIKSRLRRARERLRRVLAPHREVGNVNGTVRESRSDKR